MQEITPKEILNGNFWFPLFKLIFFPSVGGKKWRKVCLRLGERKEHTRALSNCTSIGSRTLELEGHESTTGDRFSPRLRPLSPLSFFY